MKGFQVIIIILIFFVSCSEGKPSSDDKDNEISDVSNDVDDVFDENDTENGNDELIIDENVNDMDDAQNEPDDEEVDTEYDDDLEITDDEDEEDDGPIDDKDQADEEQDENDEIEIPDVDYRYPLEKFVQISAGNSYTCGLNQDNNVFCWGYNVDEILGMENVPNENRILVPSEVFTSVKFEKIFTDSTHSYGLDKTGTAYCWGDSTCRMPGVEENGYVYRINTDIKFKILALGGGHTCGLDASGKAYCWGRTEYGALGIGDFDEVSNVYEPMAVDTDKQFKDISCGNNHTCGLTKAGEVYCWGLNELGQLGDNSTENRLIPVKADTSVFFKQIELGVKSSYALTDSGDVYSWGGNYNGQLGNGSSGTDLFELTPSKINTEVKFEKISAKMDHVCGLDSNGTAYCWGYNMIGQAGISAAGTINKIVSPTKIESDLVFSSISSGIYHTCGLSSDGVAHCWGSGSDGELGTGYRDYYKVPEAVETDVKFTALAMSEIFTCALDSEGQVYIWGLSESFGTDPYEWVINIELYPEKIDSEIAFDSISANEGTVCGIDSQKKAYCWGSNGSGQLGDGTTTGSNTPKEVDTALLFKSLASGKSHTCGIATDGKAYCWGSNNDGELGDGTKEDSLNPVSVVTTLNFQVITCGQNHTCGLTSEGSVYCWGRNSKGQLGNGESGNDDVLLPVKILSDEVFQDIGTRSDDTCGLTVDGDIYCWGYNGYGQLGNGTLENSSVPGKVNTTLKFISFTKGSYANYALAEDGFYYCWGQCNGNDDDINSITVESDNLNVFPEKMNTPVSFSSIFGGDSFACALDEEGNAYCWGNNDFGQLGINIFREVLVD